MKSRAFAPAGAKPSVTGALRWRRRMRDSNRIATAVCNIGFHTASHASVAMS